MFLILSGHQSRLVWKHYKKSHPITYKKLDVIDNRPKTTFQWFTAQWMRPALSTYLDPKTNDRINIYNLSKDIELAKSTKDEKLIKLVNIRIKYWQGIILSIGLFPLFVTIYWASIML